MRSFLIQLSYLTASLMFIWGLKDLSSPVTARRGNSVAATGMFLAIVGTLIHQEILSYTWILAGILIGSAAGAVFALKVRMTAMPQMVALLNGFGGAASALVGASEFYRLTPNLDVYLMTTTGLAVLIGALTFWGSLVAYLKLEELMRGAPLVYPFQNASNLLLFLVTLGIGVYLIFVPSATLSFMALGILSSILGVLFVLPIGGADMPVVISFLNAYSGLAGVATGFVLSNNVLIISGALVGSSGVFLSYLMCKAMNRSLTNVLFGAFGQVRTTPSMASAQVQDGKAVVQTCTVEDAAILLENAKQVIIVPGYGMAAAQAQYVIRELADLLQAKGVTVKYAIHPVAGRMPGHMNVLLAEAQVPYEQLVEMDEINPEFPQTDVALVVGANDVTNPAARYAKDSPIYGMPILDVDKAKMIIVCKRSLKPGFAGIDNELYLNEKTRMLFGDAKESIAKVVGTLKK